MDCVQRLRLNYMGCSVSVTWPWLLSRSDHGSTATFLPSSQKDFVNIMETYTYLITVFLVDRSFWRLTTNSPVESKNFSSQQKWDNYVVTIFLAASVGFNRRLSLLGSKMRPLRCIHFVVTLPIPKWFWDIANSVDLSLQLQRIYDKFGLK